MDIVGGLIGWFIGMMLLQVFADFLISTPGYFIYCILFTKREYDPDHEYDVEISDPRVLVVQLLFCKLAEGDFIELS